jgi:hypothetical protein
VLQLDEEQEDISGIQGYIEFQKTKEISVGLAGYLL